MALYLDTADYSVYKNFLEGGYKCLREPLKVSKPLDKFIPVYEYKWKSEELPPTTINILISSLDYEFSALQLGKSRAIGSMQNSLDVYFHFSKVDSFVYLVSAHAYAVRRPKSENLSISNFINQLSAQLKVFG